MQSTNERQGSMCVSESCWICLSESCWQATLQHYDTNPRLSVDPSSFQAPQSKKHKNNRIYPSASDQQNQEAAKTLLGFILSRLGMGMAMSKGALHFADPSRLLAAKHRWVRPDGALVWAQRVCSLEPREFPWKTHDLC